MQLIKIIYTIAAINGICIGLFNPVFSLKLDQMGMDSSQIGINTTVYFIGVAIFGLLSLKLISRLGVKNTLLLGLTLSASGALWFALSPTISISYPSRFMLGAGLGLYMSAAQSVISLQSSQSNAGKCSALYALCFGVGMGIGPIIATHYYGSDGTLPIYIGLLVIIAAFAITLVGLKTVKYNNSHKQNALNFDSWSRVALGGAFCYGVIEAVILTLYPVYWVHHDLSLDRLGFALTLLVVGGLLFTAPAGWLTDKWGSKPVLVITVICSIPAIALLTLAQSEQWMLFAAFMTGATAGPIFAISLAVLANSCNSELDVAKTGLFTTAFSFGCIAGPLFSAWMMDSLGAEFVFTFSLAVLLALLTQVLTNRPLVIARS